MDWIKLISELSASGVLQTEMANYCGCSQSTISDLARGVTKQPYYNIGAAIQSMHAALPAERRNGDRRGA